MVEKLNLFLDLLQSYKVSLGRSCSGPVSFRAAAGRARSSQGCGGKAGQVRAVAVGCPGPLASLSGGLRSAGSSCDPLGMPPASVGSRAAWGPWKLGIEKDIKPEVKGQEKGSVWKETVGSGLAQPGFLLRGQGLGYS